MFTVNDIAKTEILSDELTKRGLYSWFLNCQNTSINQPINISSMNDNSSVAPKKTRIRLNSPNFRIKKLGGLPLYKADFISKKIDTTNIDYVISVVSVQIEEECLCNGDPDNFYCLIGNVIDDDVC